MPMTTVEARVRRYGNTFVLQVPAAALRTAGLAVDDHVPVALLCAQEGPVGAIEPGPAPPPRRA